MSTQSFAKSPDARLAAAISAAHDRLSARLALALRDLGLTPHDLEVLEAIAASEQGRARPCDLARAARLSPSGMTRLLEGLEGAKLIERVGCAHDSRVVWARMTGAGEKALAAAAVTRSAVLADAGLGGLGAAEALGIARALDRLAEAG